MLREAPGFLTTESQCTFSAARTEEWLLNHYALDPARRWAARVRT